MIQAGSGISQKHRAITTKSSEETIWISQVYYAIQNLAAIMANSTTVFTYTVGSTEGPKAGNSTFPLPINAVTASNNPVYKNGTTLLVKGTDYNINVATGVFTLLASTFSNGDTYSFV